ESVGLPVTVSPTATLPVELTTIWVAPAAKVAVRFWLADTMVMPIARFAGGVALNVIMLLPFVTVAAVRLRLGEVREKVMLTVALVAVLPLEKEGTFALNLTTLPVMLTMVQLEGEVPNP